MKRSIFILILAVTNAFAQAKITSYNINAEYKPNADRISVNASLIFQKDEPSDTLMLLFNSDCKILSIKNHINENAFNLNYLRKGKDTLLVVLSENMKSIKDFVINFDYQYPLEKDTVILLDRGHRWYPQIADNIFTFTITVQIPENYITVSAGNIINERSFGRFMQISFESTQPVFKIPLIIAPDKYYTVKEKDCGKIKSYFYQINNGAEKLDSINIDICNLINYFSTKIGNYRHERFTLIETSVFPSSNLGSSIVTSGSDNFESYILGNKDWLGMAVASQWIGTGVFPRLFSKGFWFLSVSFPHYLRLMYLKDTKGEEVFNKEINYLYETYKKIEGTDDDTAIINIDYPNTKGKGILLFAKGVIVIDKLKNQLGETGWLNLLKYFYSEYNGKIITLEDFINSINKFDPTDSYSNKLLTMLSTKGLPD